MLKLFQKMEHKFNHVLSFKYHFRLKPYFLEISMSIRNLIMLFFLRYKREPKEKCKEKAMFKK